MAKEINDKVLVLNSDGELLAFTDKDNIDLGTQTIKLFGGLAELHGLCQCRLLYGQSTVVKSKNARCYVFKAYNGETYYIKETKQYKQYITHKIIKEL